MHSENETGRLRSILGGHLTFLVLVTGALVALYLYLENTSSVILGGTAFTLVHLAAASGVLAVGGGLLRKLIRIMHPPAITPEQHQANLETEGATISWAFLYEILVKAVMLGRDQQLRESIVSLAAVRPGEKVLDLGCGTGKLAMTFKQSSDSSVTVHGIDAAPEMVARAKSQAAKKGLDIDFRHGLAESVDLPDESLDVVVSSFVVHHLTADLQTKAFAECYRLLKPGGRLLVIEFEPPRKILTRFLLRPLLGGGMLAIDTGKIAPQLQAAGFVSVETGSAGHVLATSFSGRKPAVTVR